MVTKKKIYTLLSMLALAIASATAHDIDMLSVKNLTIERSDSSVRLTLTLVTADVKLNTNTEIKLTPVIYNLPDSDRMAEFPSVIIAGRNRYISNLRDGNATLNTIKGVPFYRAGYNEEISYSASLPYEDWMEVSEVDINTAFTGCCGVKVASKKVLPIVPVARLDFRTRAFMPRFECEAPVYSGPKERHLDGSAFVNFWVNKTFIDPYYMANPQELHKILATIKVVKDDPDTKVTGIWIKGFASPEGPYDNNVRLAKGRTEALKEYVSKESGFDRSLFTTDYEPEDWAGLRRWVVDSLLTNREEVLAIIDSDLEPDAKNTKIQRTFPREYAYILKHVYPWLRHSDYRVEYEVRDYDNVDTIRMLVNTNPGKLSLREFYVAATSYEPGTEEYDNVFETAVRLYPDDPVANINAANAVMSRGDYTAAARYLQKAGDGAYAQYARGVLASLQGDYDAARPLFEDAERGGIKAAGEALEQLATLAEYRHTINYIDITNKK